MMLDKVLLFYNEHKNNNYRSRVIERPEYSGIKEYIDQFIVTYYQDRKLSFSEKLYLIINGITEYPLCSCGKERIFKTLNVGYSRYCNDRNCTVRKDAVISTMVKTNQYRYGVSCTLHTEESIKKKKKTFLSRYGTDHPNKNKEVKEKIKSTNISRYGVEYTVLYPEFIAKKEDTCISRYGVSNVFLSDAIKDKIKLTNLERYGVEYPIHTELIQEKCKNTLMQNYGVDNPMHSDTIKDRLRTTINERYGCNNISQINFSQETIDVLSDKELFQSLYRELQSTVLLGNMLGVSRDTVVEYLHYYGIDIIFNKISTFHAEIAEFLDNLNIQYVNNDRKLLGNKELDIFIPDYNLAIECNGSFWHSESNGKDKNYHLDKTKACNEKGIHLVHIWEHLWNDKKEIIKSRLTSLLQQSQYKIYARKCIIKEITSAEASKFLDKTHIQGSCNSSVRLALFYESEICALMTFGKSRYNKRVDWELLRFSSSLSTNVVGAASRLFKYFVDTHSPASVISYSDREANKGNLYRVLGFSFTHYTSPSYFYTKNYKVFENRLMYQKHKLNNYFDNIDNLKTEWEIMQDNGYDRIWNCGNSVWLWTIDDK